MVIGADIGCAACESMVSSVRIDFIGASTEIRVSVRTTDKTRPNTNSRFDEQQARHTNQLHPP
jgi:hypothetical protein